jgi:glycosyltransferase involved in cell wall biosynthesis
MELSVVIITLNEEDRLGRTLEAVAPIADEIVIVDSGSTDRTRDVASAFANVVWLERQFNSYGKQKNFGNDYASGRYILSLDADEVLSSALRSEIAAEKGKWRADVYALRRLPMYIGREIRCTDWYPDVKWRLFRRDVARWSDDPVHERLLVHEDARRHVFSGELLHYSYTSIAEHLQRNIRYSTLAAAKRFATGHRPAMPKAFLRAALRFFKSFVLKKGYRAGWRGWAIATLGAAVYLQRELLLAERWDQHHSQSERLSSSIEP